MIDKWTIKIKRGFTLIELIIVIAILGILVLLAAPNFLGKTQDAEHVKIMADSKNIEDASVMYHLENEDWPRLTDDPYTADELELFASDFSDKTGKEITLDPNGSYYNIDYDELSQYIKAPDNKKDYILQNPVGKVFHMENLTEAGENRVDYDTETEEPEDPVEETLYEFTTAGKTGELGPTQADLDEAYKGTSLEGKVSSDGGVQIWTVPKSGRYRIEAYGASGGKDLSGNVPGGQGAIIKGDINLSVGQKAMFLTGQIGSNSISTTNASGGGGGTFVYLDKNSQDPLIAAGGGGGALGPLTSYPKNIGPGIDATASGTVKNSGGGQNVSNNNISGEGAGFGGAGWRSNGDTSYQVSYSAKAPRNGGSGRGGYGGFGGGSGASWASNAGAGGGYTGGIGAYYVNGGRGSGGGSYNSGENQENSVGNAGPGKVIITYLGE